jgi:uncharacterized protein with FMN-binding domain
LRRAVLAIVGTAVGTTALVGLKAGLAVGQQDNAAATAPLTPTASGSPVPGAGGGGPNTARPTGPAPAGAASSRVAAPSRAAGGTGLRQGAFTGAVAQTPYGAVQVRVTVAAGRLTDVTALTLPKEEPRSVDLSARAGPALRQEALKAQSAKINAVSGATYTSQGYVTSLQSALDAAKRG